jgi:hypothetical protein
MLLGYRWQMLMILSNRRWSTVTRTLEAQNPDHAGTNWSRDSSASKDVKIERVADVDGRATASLSRSSYVLY